MSGYGYGSSGSGDVPTEAGSQVFGGLESTIGGPPSLPTHGSQAGIPRSTGTIRSYVDDRSGPIEIELAPGTIVGDAFRIEGRLGAGGMGVVYRGTHLKLDRPVAIKLHPGGDGDAARLEREARAMARLSHPNVIGVFDVGTWRDAFGELHVFVAMEYCDAGTLRAFVARRPDWRTALDLCRQAGDGLAAAHAAGLVHRDFKPDNVLLSSDPQGPRMVRVRVADFGLARTQGPLDATGASTAPTGTSAAMLAPADQLTRTGVLVGTPAYMAPEQFGGGAVDARADQFAFCVVVYEALWGRRPFTGATAGELLYNITMRGPLEPARSDVPPRVWSVLRRGLDPDPRRRWPTMRALLGELDRARTATGPSKALIAVALGVPIAVVVGTGVFAWRLAQPDAEPRPTVVANAEVDDEPEDADEDEPPEASPLLAMEAREPEPPELTDTEGESGGVDELALAEKRWAAVQQVSEEDIAKDPLAVLRAMENAEKAGAGDLAIGLALAQGMMDSLDTDVVTTPPWDGKSTLHCGVGNNFKIEGKTIEVAEGPAFEASAGCVLEIVDCTITAKVIVDANNARLTIRGSTLTASESLGELSNLGSLEIRDTEMTCPSTGPGLTVLHTEGSIVDSHLRGVPALHARAGAQLYIEGGTIEGDPSAIVAVNGSVELADVTVTGGVERKAGASVTTVAKRGAPAGH